MAVHARGACPRHQYVGSVCSGKPKYRSQNIRATRTLLFQSSKSKLNALRALFSVPSVSVLPIECLMGSLTLSLIQLTVKFTVQRVEQ